MRSRLKLLHFVLACAAPAWFLPALAAPDARAPDARALDAAIEREHAAGRFDGTVLVGQGDAVAYQRAIGLADRETKRPHRPGDVWRWASVSKQVAAVLAMQQVEQGRLSLDASLATLLPSFKAPRAADITLRQLLQHTSGLPNPDARPSFYMQQFGDEGGPVTAALRYCSGPPAGEPGARFAYNNCDTLVLQAVLEKATGQTYAQLVQAAIAQPLGLQTLALTPARLRPEETPLPMSRGYLDATREEPGLNLPSFGAAGALRGSAEDLWRFDRALMQGRLLGAAARRTLWQGEPALGYVALGAWSFSAPLAGCAGPVALVERRGQIGGVQVRNLIAPELGAALIVFSNTAATVFGEIWQGQGLAHELASAAFCARPPTAPTAATPGGGGAAVPSSGAAATPPAKQDKPDKPEKWNVDQPPGAARTVNIDTRTGTWMSVDVSPDGKTLVFDLLGDLYTLPIEGGDAKPLTSSIAWDHQARFSPDGSKIAYVSDAGGGDNVWVMNLDANGQGSGARAVTTEDYRLLNNPAWHPGGQYILARKHYTGTRSAGSGEIWLYHLDGGKGVALNEKPNWQKDLGEPAISPDGRFVYYSRDSTPGNTFEYNKDSNKEIFKIFRIDLNNGSTEAFVEGPGGAVRPVPSPDGRHLAFVRRVRNQSTLFLKDLKTGAERPVWGKLERDLQEAWSVYGVYPSFAWTPDSRNIVVWAQGRLWRLDPFKGTEAEIPFRVRHTREVREALRVPQAVSPDSFPVRQLRWAQVSPDGGRVVYSALGHLYTKDLNAQGPAAEPRRLTTQTTHFENFPSLARDGRSLVYVSWNDQTQGQVRRLDLATGKDTVVTPTPGKYLSPRLSPDGKTVVYVKARGAFLTPPWQGLDTGVYIAASDGSGEPLRLTKDGEAPQFGARSDEVFVSRSTQPAETEVRRSLWRIHTVDRSESEVARGEFIGEYSVSPDGRWLGFVERFHAYVAPFPLTGKPLTVGPRMDGVPVRQLSLNAGQNLHFSGDSRQAHFTSGDRLFSVALGEAFAPAAAEPPAGTEAGQRAAFKPPTEGRAIGFVARSDRPTGRIAITGARVATMRGVNAQEVIDDAVILVEGHRIAAIGPAGSVAIPADAQRVDARGKTIVPGFIDAHWHGSMGEDGIVPQQNWVNLASLAFGVTALHDPSNRNDHIFTQAELQRTGQVLGPRIYSTGSVLYGAKAGITAIVNNLDDAMTHLNRQQANGAISVKSYNQPRRDQRQMLLEAARRTGMMVVPEGGSMFQLNMSQIVDGHTGLEHALPIAEVYDDVTQLWQQTKVGYTPTLNVAYGGPDGEHYWYARTDVWRHPLLSRYVPPGVLQSRSVRRPTAPEEDFNVLRVARTATALQRAGVPAMIGAHGQREGLGAHWEMWMFGLGGMTPLEALRTATLNPARHFGLDADLGSLDVGKLADLVVIDGDVLADIRQSDRITHVMQNGRLYEAATLGEVVSRQRPRAPFFFEGADARWQAMLDAHTFCAGH